MGFDPTRDRIISTAPNPLRLAYEQGRNAFLNGWRTSVYIPGTRRYRWWIAGWTDEQSSN